MSAHVSTDDRATKSAIFQTKRQAVLAEAREWLGTPYRHMGRVKGRAGGVDCLTLLAEVYARAGIVPPVEIRFYPPDWHLHRGEEHYAEGLLGYARPVDRPEAGDIALFRFGRAFAHGAIVTLWPRLIHAWNRAGVVEGDATQPELRVRPVLFFSPRAFAGAGSRAFAGAGFAEEAS